MFVLFVFADVIERHVENLRNVVVSDGIEDDLTLAPRADEL